MNELNESEVAAWRNAVVHGLMALRDGDIAFIDGVRQVLALSNEASPRSPDFDLLVAIESETHHLPSMHARQECSEAWLAHCDLELQEVQDRYGSRVRALAEKLLKKLGAT